MSRFLDGRKIPDHYSPDAADALRRTIKGKLIKRWNRISKLQSVQEERDAGKVRRVLSSASEINVDNAVLICLPSLTGKNSDWPLSPYMTRGVREEVMDITLRRLGNTPDSSSPDAPENVRFVRNRALHRIGHALAIEYAFLTRNSSSEAEVRQNAIMMRDAEGQPEKALVTSCSQYEPLSVHGEIETFSENGNYDLTADKRTIRHSVAMESAIFPGVNSIEPAIHAVASLAFLPATLLKASKGRLVPAVAANINDGEYGVDVDPTGDFERVARGSFVIMNPGIHNEGINWMILDPSANERTQMVLDRRLAA